MADLYTAAGAREFAVKAAIIESASRAYAEDTSVNCSSVTSELMRMAITNIDGGSFVDYMNAIRLCVEHEDLVTEAVTERLRRVAKFHSGAAVLRKKHAN